MSETGGTVHAVILGDGCNAVDMEVSLRAHGIVPTVVTDSTGSEVQRDFPAAIECPSAADPERLLAFFEQQLFPGEPVVLLPSSDRFAVALALLRPRIDPRFRYLAPPPEIAETCADKVRFLGLCERLGINAPRTCVLAGPDDLAANRDGLPFPAIVKPPYSGAIPKSIIPKVLRVRDLDELEAIATRVWAIGQTLIVQEEIPGSSEQIVFIGGLYGPDQQPDKIFCGKKLLEFPLLGGGTTHSRLEWDPQAVELSNRFARETGFSGLIDIEFKRDPRDGSYRVIEVNPRIGQWHRISDDGRLDIISYYFRRLADPQFTAPDYAVHREGRSWIYPYLQLSSNIEKFGLLVGTARTLREFWRTPLRCDWRPSNLRKTAAQLRAVLGHVKRLGRRRLLQGSSHPS